MKKLGITCGLLGLTGVTLGAFGAHALKVTLLERGSLATWETAVHYHLIHAVALLALTAGAGHGEKPPAFRSWLQRAGWCWTLGVILFSGSLYALALGGPRWLGPVTPLGGLALIAGWTSIVIAFIKTASNVPKS